jgi:hypothetical protein
VPFPARTGRWRRTTGFAAAASSPYTRPAIFVEFHLSTGIVYTWTGRGPLSWNGHTWTGVGTFGGLSIVEEGTNIQARGITLTLTGLNPALLDDVLNEYSVGLPVNVYLGLFDNAGTLIPDPVCCWAGETDQPTISVSGDEASIEISCENKLVQMNVAVERRYTHEDQQLEHPGDLGFEFVNAIQDIGIFWGRHPASAPNFAAQGHED